MILPAIVGKVPPASPVLLSYHFLRSRQAGSLRIASELTAWDGEAPAEPGESAARQEPRRPELSQMSNLVYLHAAQVSLHARVVPHPIHHRVGVAHSRKIMNRQTLLT